MRRWAPWLLLAIGAALRLGLYFSRPSLSIDETMTSLEIGARSFAGLLHVLDYAQTAPPLFLWAVKLCTVIGGMNEYALRAMPLILGLLVLPLIWRVARRLMPEPFALTVLLLAAVTPTLIEYSVTVKPYIGDACFALLLMGLTLEVLDRPAERGPWWRLAAAGCVAILASTPAPFYLAGVFVAIVRTPGAPRRLLWCAGLWGIVFAPVYILLFRPVAVSPYMQQFWGTSFLAPLDAASWHHMGVALLQSLDARPAPLAAVLAFAVLLALGCWAWSRRPSPAAALIGVPGFFVLAASLVHRYPLSGRVLIFLAPAFLFYVAAAIEQAHARARAVGWMLGGVVVGLLAGIDVTHPYRTPATRTAVAELVRRLGPGEPVYVASGATPAWGFYTTDWSAPDTAFVHHLARTAGVPGSPAFHNSASRGEPVGATEGSDLVFRRAGRVELLGLAAGIQWRDGVGFGRLVHADSGWAEREAARIRAAAAPTIWILVANPYPTTVQELMAAIARAGGVSDSGTVIGGVRLARYRF